MHDATRSRLLGPYVGCPARDHSMPVATCVWLATRVHGLYGARTVRVRRDRGAQLSQPAEQWPTYPAWGERPGRLKDWEAHA